MTGHPSGADIPKLSTEEVRVLLGAATIRSASRTLHRLGVHPVSREPGRSGMNLYDAGEVQRALASRPGRGRTQDQGADPGADLDPLPSEAIRHPVAESGG